MWGTRIFPCEIIIAIMWIISFIGISKLTFDTGSAKDMCTAYFQCKRCKNSCKISYRAYKKLYYVIFDGICCALFLSEMNLNSLEQQLPIPCNWETLENDEKIKWLDDISCKFVRNWFFENSDMSSPDWQKSRGELLDWKFHKWEIQVPFLWQIKHLHWKSSV